MQNLVITSPAFAAGQWIPIAYTARGKDISPPLNVSGLAEGAVSLAITLDDASHPLFPNYNHWVIWNLPVLSVIPAAIPRGERVPSLGSAVQGVAYGRHCYKGPKPPLKLIHDYTFTVYALDCMLELPPDSGRKDFLAKVQGHVLQKGTLTGKFQSRRVE